LIFIGIAPILNISHIAVMAYYIAPIQLTIIAIVWHGLGVGMDHLTTSITHHARLLAHRHE
jgi:hypothetical protein